MRPTDPSPFAVLGLAPTLDPARVKRAYFAALAQHPPHSDPQGFQAIRGAYEALQREGLVAAYLAAPLDLAAEAAALGPELPKAREQAVLRARCVGAGTIKLAGFEAMLRLELPFALARAR